LAKIDSPHDLLPLIDVSGRDIDNTNVRELLHALLDGPEKSVTVSKTSNDISIFIDRSRSHRVTTSTGKAPQGAGAPFGHGPATSYWVTQGFADGHRRMPGVIDLVARCDDAGIYPLRHPDKLVAGAKGIVEVIDPLPLERQRSGRDQGACTCYQRDPSASQASLYLTNP
jgi:hypothetical protein